VNQSGEELNLSPITRMLSHKCPGCGQRLAVTLEVTARFNQELERWNATAKCGACVYDLTGIAAMLCALGVKGNQRISEIKPPRIWDPQ